MDAALRPTAAQVPELMKNPLFMLALDKLPKESVFALLSSRHNLSILNNPKAFENFARVAAKDANLTRVLLNSKNAIDILESPESTTLLLNSDLETLLDHVLNNRLKLELDIAYALNQTRLDRVSNRLTQLFFTHDCHHEILETPLFFDNFRDLSGGLQTSLIRYGSANTTMEVLNKIEKYEKFAGLTTGSAQILLNTHLPYCVIDRLEDPNKLGQMKFSEQIAGIRLSKSHYDEFIEIVNHLPGPQAGKALLAFSRMTKTEKDKFIKRLKSIDEGNALLNSPVVVDILTNDRYFEIYKSFDSTPSAQALLVKDLKFFEFMTT